ncbi:MAG: DNA polymerase/3'-5' exonuclease PolX [Phycisphaeraceae bacterium]|nr:DNA polymerase/3'-5' exonuclease PolX [Phycisphaeraceae bacterium]
MPRNNAQLAMIFQQMADVNQVVGGNRFKTIALEKGARVLKDFVKDVGDVDPQDLLQVEGIGKGIAQKIGEFLRTGQVVEHQEMIDNVPAGVLQMLDIPGLGPKGVAQLWNDGGVESIDELKTKIADGSLEPLKGFGKKKLEKLSASIAFAEKAGERTHLGYALPLALAMIAGLEDVKGVERIEYAGSLRRGKETIGDIDLLVAAKQKDAPGIMDVFIGLPMVEEVLGHGETKSSIRCDDEHRNIQVDLRVVDPKHYGAALMYFTGSKEHNVKVRERAQSMGYTLNEYALADKDDKTKQIETKAEEAIYKKLGLAWVPPELREDRGEIILAEQGKIPNLIELKDIKADLHTHTTASDGKWSIEENALAMAARGHHTVAITDHSKGQVQANGLSDERLVNHIEAVREVAKKLKGKITVLAGSEVDILSDGKLDYPDELLAELDVVVASPHAALSQDPKKATKRLLKAIENPYVTMIGHPTGRLVLRREGLSPDIEALVKAAAGRGIALEINANHWRLDLRDTHARLALEHGVKLAINTDAHGQGDLTQLPYGVLTARRAGATKNDVINCMTAAGLNKWLKSTRP